ncbi:transmembrane protein, putative (macronuclear) [Tetrahymena thermophila SB210]|uniref:Transmembrane protein, putative n=1 Tax=Tetrahymena thermophila (strain SB210) TaxID=312017 RepID=W7XD72_TETTS|nr:transmembrane protein, putative [Tetrahymena thermophila SB210]EWS71771.1 transmembrane protein, putative [Tetrahymena thermophila SB210]|eukprot:XP_012655658.1 transmembrane protein, putative [Tetrahymena thermophila SB210]
MKLNVRNLINQLIYALKLILSLLETALTTSITIYTLVFNNVSPKIVATILIMKNVAQPTLKLEIVLMFLNQIATRKMVVENSKLMQINAQLKTILTNVVPQILHTKNMYLDVNNQTYFPAIKLVFLMLLKQSKNYSNAPLKYQSYFQLPQWQFQCFEPVQFLIIKFNSFQFMQIKCLILQIMFNSKIFCINQKVYQYQSIKIKTNLYAKKYLDIDQRSKKNQQSILQLGKANKQEKNYNNQLIKTKIQKSFFQHFSLNLSQFLVIIFTYC